MDTADMTVKISLDASSLADQLERIAQVFRDAATALRADDPTKAQGNGPIPGGGNLRLRDDWATS